MPRRRPSRSRRSRLSAATCFLFSVLAACSVYGCLTCRTARNTTSLFRQRPAAVIQATTATSALRPSVSGGTIQSRPSLTPEYNMRRRRVTILRRREAPRLRLAESLVERLDVPGRGADIPLTVLRQRDQSEPMPFVLYVCGAYGVSLEPRFSVLPFGLLERGVGYAVCHVRVVASSVPVGGSPARGRGRALGSRTSSPAHSILLRAGSRTPGGLVRWRRALALFSWRRH